MLTHHPLQVSHSEINESPVSKHLPGAIFTGCDWFTPPAKVSRRNGRETDGRRLHRIDVLTYSKGRELANKCIEKPEE